MYRSYDSAFGVHQTYAVEVTDLSLVCKSRSSPFAEAYDQLVIWTERHDFSIERDRGRE